MEILQIFNESSSLLGQSCCKAYHELQQTVVKRYDELRAHGYDWDAAYRILVHEYPDAGRNDTA